MRRAQHLVEATIRERDAAVAQLVGQPVAALRPNGAAQFEDVREVGVERERHECVLGGGGVVRDRDSFAKAVGDDALAHDAERLPTQHDLRPVQLSLRIGE